MRNIQLRLNKLERLPQFQPPPGPLEKIEHLAAKKLSDKDLDVLLILDRDMRGGVSREMSETELAAWEVYRALRETEAQRMGFESLDDPERIAGP
ncbi:MAG: hypothetical protein ABSB35_34795 [Bryobacteraceae bacterium]|jgi:hypothetical protein